MTGKYGFFHNELKPSGWLKNQLKIQLDGLCGDLDRVWPDVKDSAWFGGNREGWERVPYWLDGFIPLVYLLDDICGKERAKKYIDIILKNQRPDGWICPNGDVPLTKYDTWAVMLIGKVLTVYYGFTHDERVLDAAYRLMKNYYELLSSGEVKLFSWGKYRWFECFVTLNRLAERYGAEDWMRSLADILVADGADYAALTDRYKTPSDVWNYDTHIVNTAMMLKYECEVCNFYGSEYTDIAEKLFETLYRYNGTPAGIFTGDECLGGLSPVRGSELCSVTELMYSFERLYAFTGDAKWAERLETVAFNALPAAFQPDMRSHQYDQLSNQTACVPFEGKSPFATNSGEANIFGLEPNFGCCTANFGQGFPKLALSAFMKSDSGAVCAVPLPSRLSLTWKNVPIDIRLDTDYPFGNSLRFCVKADGATDFVLAVRIPAGVTSPKLNGSEIKNDGMVFLNGFAKGESEYILTFERTPVLQSRPYGLKCVRYGSLVFSLPIAGDYKTVEYEKDGVARKYPYCDYHISPVSEWEYAFASSTLKITQNAVSDVPFSHSAPPLCVEAEVYKTDWGTQNGLCKAVPQSRAPLGEKRPVKLVPYGCTDLRMTELPLISCDTNAKKPAYGLLDNADEIRSRFIEEFVLTFKQCEEKFAGRPYFNKAYYDSDFMWCKAIDGFAEISFQNALNLLRDMKQNVLFMSEAKGNASRNYCELEYGDEKRGYVACADSASLADALECEWYDENRESCTLCSENEELIRTFDRNPVLPDDVYVFDESFSYCLIFTHESDGDGESPETRYCLYYGG